MGCDNLAVKLVAAEENLYSCSKWTVLYVLDHPVEQWLEPAKMGKWRERDFDGLNPWSAIGYSSAGALVRM